MADYLNPRRDDWDAIAAEGDDEVRLDYGLDYRWEKRLDTWLSSSTRGRLYAALR